MSNSRLIDERGGCSHLIDTVRGVAVVKSVDEAGVSAGVSAYPSVCRSQQSFSQLLLLFVLKRHLEMVSSPFRAKGSQVGTYLLGVALFSISFLVFLNASVSFVITDLIGQRKRVGDAVGSLGFTDELVALVACPFWGLLSDRLGVRWVSYNMHVMWQRLIFVSRSARSAML